MLVACAEVLLKPTGVHTLVGCLRCLTRQQQMLLY